MSKNTNDNENNIRNATVELVRNPYIALNLKEKQKEQDFMLNESIFVPMNQDKLYNDNVSNANMFFKYSDKIKESSNIRYVKISSGIVPDSYIYSLIENGIDKDDDIMVPYDYLLITRTDGTQFLVAENFTKELKDENLHSYSIVRYVNKRELFREDIIYSDGIDLSRLLSDDTEYINVFSNEFLSERRLNESLMTVYSALDIQKSDETNHGGQYVGYINSNDLSIGTTMEKNELLLFEKNLREGRI